jgi:mycofactocin biosynthesis protein MftB
VSIDPLERAWCVHEQVAVRPERFGALLYHFGTRRLSFLKDPKLLIVLRSLAEHGTARDACLHAGVPEAELPSYRGALVTLARSRMIEERVVA